MNWWLVAGGAMALICAAGHAIAGWGMFYRPIMSDVRDKLHAGLFTGIWHIITINFTLSGVALVALSTASTSNDVLWLVEAQLVAWLVAAAQPLKRERSSG